MGRGKHVAVRLLLWGPRHFGKAAAFSSTAVPEQRVLPWLPRLKVAASMVVGVGLGALGLCALGPEPRRSLHLVWSVPLRLGNNFTTAAIIAADYKYSLYGLEEGSPEWAKAKHEAHLRCANRLQELCFKNGGIYIKLGQHIGQLEYLLPQEYVEMMRNSMLDKCPVSSYDQVCDIIKSELGGLPHEIFKDFNPVPLASASLAQVHAALTLDGTKVAVKVQHMHLTDTAAVDIATVKLVVKAVHLLFPNFDYRWLIAEVQESAPQELDFMNEAKNGERCAQNFRKMSPHLAPWIYVPKVYWDLSTSKVLTMEFIDGVKVTDVNAIKKLGLKPNDVSKLINRAFAEMIFRHGFVHCDPHAANMMVRTTSSLSHGIFGRGQKPQLVLLDHGLYKELSPKLREDYAALWKALVFANVEGIRKQSLKLGAGEDLYILFAGVLTMRPWNKIIQQDINHLRLGGNAEDKSEIQMYASQYVTEISELLRRLPRVLLLLLKTNDCLRAVDHVLGSSINTFAIIARESSRAVTELRLAGHSTLWLRLRLGLDTIKVEIRVLALQVTMWFLQTFRKIPMLRFPQQSVDSQLPA